jgi:uncharacterized membrane protein YgcG
VRKSSGIVGALLVLFSTFALAAEPMRVQDVLDLLEAGVGERVIIAQIEASGSDFRLETSDIVRLQEMGVGERIIEAMIRSGGEVEECGDEEGEEAVLAVVPSHLGFSRYGSTGAVAVRMVPWSVPHVSVVYADWDPWFWDPWWWDTYFYVSYGSYPWYRTGWHASYWYDPHPWWYWHDAHRWCSPGPHHDGGHGGPQGAPVSHATYWKKKTVQREVSGTPRSPSSRYRTAKGSSTRETAGGTRSRVYAPRKSGRDAEAAPSGISRKRTRTDTSQPKITPPPARDSGRIVPSRAPSRGSAPSSGATRSSSGSSGRGSGSSSAGGRKHSGR